MLSSAITERILEHLGGRRLLESIGAHNFMSDDNQISFTLGSTPRNVHAVTIAEQTRGVYRVNCYGHIARGTFQAPLIGSAGGVVADNLATVLGQLTGLDSLLHRHF